MGDTTAQCNGGWLGGPVPLVERTELLDLLHVVVLLLAVDDRQMVRDGEREANSSKGRSSLRTEYGASRTVAGREDSQTSEDSIARQLAQR